MMSRALIHWTYFTVHRGEVLETTVFVARRSRIRTAPPDWLLRAAGPFILGFRQRVAPQAADAAPDVAPRSAYGGRDALN